MNPGEAVRDDAGAEIPGFWAVVPAGGSGTRLWPLSRGSAPKFLHDLTGSGRSLLQQTVDRITPLAGDRIVVVTGDRHSEPVRQQLLGVSRGRLLVEPTPRDSMPAIGLAAALVERQQPDAVIGSFAADHVVGDDAAFGRCVREAVAAAREGWLVTLGVRPSYPATGFGYIEVGAPLDLPAAPTAHRVDSFVEKPDRPTAQEYLDSGRYRWNAGMFVVGATVLLDLLAQHHPQLAAGLRSIAADPSRMRRQWPQLERIAIDHAVAEPAAAAGRVAVVPADFPWDDVGDFASLAAVLARDGEEPDVRVLGRADLVLNEGSTGFVAPQSGRTVVTLGIPDVVVVDTADALLVTTRERVQDVKGIVEALRAMGREDLT